MKPARFSATVAALLVVLSGCDDPAPLSADLVDTTAGAPEIVEFSLGALEPTYAGDVTGNARRSLVGTVDDPSVGRIVTAAGIDFASPVVLSDDFRNGPVTEAELRMVRSYRYGDTTSTVQVAVRSIDEEWVASGLTSRATIPFGSIITTGEVAGQDTLLRVQMPPSWIEDNSELLRSTDFLNGFQGFYLESTGGNAVLGMSSSASAFRVISGTDTIDFVVSRNLTLISRETTALPPAGTSVLQDGVGDGLEIDFGAAVDSLAGTALNRIVLRVPVDSTAAALPPNFVRPRPSQIDFAAVTEDSVVVTLAVSVKDEFGFRFESSSMNSVAQSILLGTSVFTRYVLKGHLDVAPVENTIDVLFIPDGAGGAVQPKLVLTVVNP